MNRQHNDSSTATHATSDTPSPELQQWISNGHYFRFDDYRIFYQDNEKDSDTTILMIHGFPTSSWDWHELVSALGSEYRVIAIDMLGFGFSAKPRDHDYSIDEQVELHRALLKSLDINQVHIIAHDYGGLVAQEMLARFNARASSTPAIQSLVLINGPVNMTEIDDNLSFSQRMGKNIISGPLGGLASWFTTRFAFDIGFVTFFGDATRPSDQALRDNWFIISQQGGRTLFHKLAHFYGEGLQQGERWIEAIKNTQIPVLAINGLADPILGEQSADEFSATYPRIDLQVLANIGHYPQLEDSAAVAALYQDFLSGLNTSEIPSMQSRFQTR